MVQAHAQQLHNQKNVADEHPLLRSTERVLAALDRLEHALDQRERQPRLAVQHEPQLALFEQENAALRQEKDEMGRTIRAIEAQYGELQRVAGTIYNKLEDSIKRLTQILDQ
jgi:hypothetical protein